MKVGAIRYYHAFGTDIIMFRTNLPTQEFPDITNELLEKLGIALPELGEGGEWAEYIDPMAVRELPVLQ